MVYLFVEGPHDRLFHDEVTRRHVGDDCLLTIVEYVEEKPAKIQAYVRSLLAAGISVIFTCDRDPHLDVGEARGHSCSKYDIDANLVTVVEHEIESWFFSGTKNYLAGNGAKIAKLESTLSKEQFDPLIPASVTKTSFLTQIALQFDKALAARENRSFRVFSHETMRELLGRPL